MSNYIYLAPQVIYEKLKELLKEGVQFSTNIRDKYFCIYGKSKVLAFKVGRQWYVNTDNWGVTEEMLYDLDINSITPGGFSLKEMKASIPNYDMLWPNLNSGINKAIKSGYNSGLLYAKPGVYNHKVYHYDLNSAYGYAFKNAELPVGIPEIIAGHVPPDDEHVCIYFMDLSVEYNNPEIFPYLVNSNDLFYTPSEIVDNTGLHSLYKVITSTEYYDLIKDYDVISETLYTLKFKKSKGLFDKFVDKYFDLKNTTTGDARTIYKSVLASLAGKLAQEITQTQIPLGINAFGDIDYETRTVEPTYHNPAVSLFVVDYVRKIVRDMIRKGYKHVVLVDTDGFVSTKELDIPISDALGGWKVTTYDRILVNGKRSYFYEKNNELHSSISGFGDIYGDEVNNLTFDEIMNFMKLSKPLPLHKKVMYNGEYKWVLLSIRLGKGEK